MSRIAETISSSDLTEEANINAIYDFGLYKPKYVPGDSDLGETVKTRTFESLNGDLGKSNIADRYKFTADAFKVGTFARGYFYGFDFPDRYHEAQFAQDPVKLKNDDAKSAKRFFVSSYSLSANVFIPYSSIVFISYQGFFCSESYKKSATPRAGVDGKHKYKANRFRHHLYVDGVEQETMLSVAPTSKHFSSSASGSPNEFRWRWQNRSKTVYLNKGYHEIELCVEGLLPISYDLTGKHDGDVTRQKLQHRCGSISVVAMKVGSKSPSTTSHWSWLSINDSGDDVIDVTDGGLSVIVPPGTLDLDLDVSSPDALSVGSPTVSLGLGSMMAEEDHSRALDGYDFDSGDTSGGSTTATLSDTTILIDSD